MVNSSRIDVAAQADIIERLARKLVDCYIFPEIAGEIGVCLRKHLEAGDYDGIDEGDFYALALTTHMQEVCHDEHLWVRWHLEVLPDDESQLRLNPVWQAERQLAARLDNYGFHKAERLPGSVGYLDIRYFHRPEWAADTVAAAMTFLADTHALIIDLRQCTGGFPAMVALFSSYFFGDEPLHVDSIYWRDEDITQEFWTSLDIPGKRYGDKPVYALISKVTFSGGEMFANFIKTQHRAFLIGEKTDGGAHAGASYRIHPHFEAFIPIGLVINPITGANWEGSGVSPDISVPPDQAFTVAYQLALRSIIADLGEPSPGPLKQLVEEARAVLKNRETG
jgi:hypothetical protein